MLYLTQARIIGFIHAEESVREDIRLKTLDGIATGEVDVIADDADIPHRVAFIDGPYGIGHDERLYPQDIHEPDRVGNLLRAVPLIAVETPLHAEDLFASQGPADEASCMAGGCRGLHMGNVREGERNGILDALGHRTPARPQDDTDLRPAPFDPCTQYRR